MKWLRSAALMAVAFTLGVLWSDYRRQPTSAGGAPLTPLAPLAQLTPLPAPGLSRALDDLAALSPATSARNETALVPSVLSPWESIQQLLAAGEQVRALQMLRDYLSAQPQAAEAWLLMAKIQQQRGNDRDAIAAWFSYLQHEPDALRVSEAIAHLQRYLLQLAQNPSLFGEERQWLMAQINALIRLTAEDGELHLALARLHQLEEDKDLAQYHALMALNHLGTQPRAEALLLELNAGQAAVLEASIEVPLIRKGNQFLVELYFEGQPARLLLDTGASITGLTNQYLQRHPYLVKNRKPIQLNTASGKVDTYLFSVEQLTFADIHFPHHLLAHLPMGDMRDFDGLLGVDILGRFDFVIDQNNARLHLSKRAPGD